MRIIDVLDDLDKFDTLKEYKPLDIVKYDNMHIPDCGTLDIRDRGLGRRVDSIDVSRSKDAFKLRAEGIVYINSIKAMLMRELTDLLIQRNYINNAYNIRISYREVNDGYTLTTKLELRCDIYKY